MAYHFDPESLSRAIINEAEQTKALKLSRLSHEDMVGLLLLTLAYNEKFHKQVRRLEDLLDADVLFFTSNRKLQKMALTLCYELEADGAAIARVIVNASKDKSIEGALKRVGLYGGRIREGSHLGRKASARQHHEEMMAKFRMPRLDRDRYTPLKGMEGPFQFKGGEILYYDPREGKYYDRDADMYLSDRDADRITSRTAYKLAGSGLKSVQTLLPGTTDREANQFLHALSALVVDGDVLDSRIQKIKGELEVETPSHGIHPSSPSYPENDFVNGTTGAKVQLEIEVEMDDLERLAKINVSDLYLDNARAVHALCDAITKNINGNILRNMDDEELDLAFGEVQHEVEYDIPEYHNLTHIEIVEHDYKVIGLDLKGDRAIVATVLVRVEYGIFVEFDKDAWEADKY